MLFSHSNFRGVLAVLALHLATGVAIQAQTNTPAMATETETFSMILASDPQFPFATRDNFLVPDPNGDVEVDGARYRKKTEAAVENESKVNNANHVISMMQLAAPERGHNIKGVIMNGDLTNNGTPPQLNVYKKIYHEIPLPLYIGLGNHDYANYVELWGFTNPEAIGKLKGVPASNWGGEASVGYMMQRVGALGIRGENFDRSGNAVHIKGSLAYSWDVGNVHFVQLHNYPLYHVNFVGLAKRYDLNICLDWLERDLERARAAGRFIILNYHDSNQHWADFLSDEQARVLTDMFRRLITRYGVTAVFCGHYHENISETTDNGDKTARRLLGYKVTKAGWVKPPNGYVLTSGAPADAEVAPPTNRLDIYGNIPLFYCGSASWSRYLLVEFDQRQRQMNVTTVDSSNNGTPALGASVNVPLRTQ